MIVLSAARKQALAVHEKADCTFMSTLFLKRQLLNIV